MFVGLVFKCECVIVAWCEASGGRTCLSLEVDVLFVGDVRVLVAFLHVVELVSEPVHCTTQTPRSVSNAKTFSTHK